MPLLPLPKVDHLPCKVGFSCLLACTLSIGNWLPLLPGPIVVPREGTSVLLSRKTRREEKDSSQDENQAVHTRRYSKDYDIKSKLVPMERDDSEES